MSVLLLLEYGISHQHMPDQSTPLTPEHGGYSVENIRTSVSLSKLKLSLFTQAKLVC